MVTAYWDANDVEEQPDVVCVEHKYAHTSINKLRMRNALTHMLLRGLNYITN